MGVCRKSRLQNSPRGNSSNNDNSCNSNNSNNSNNNNSNNKNHDNPGACEPRGRDLWRRPTTIIKTTIMIIVTTPNLPTNIVDFGGFDSIIVLFVRGGIPRPTGNFPESLSQAMLVGTILVGRSGVVVEVMVAKLTAVLAPASHRDLWRRARHRGSPGSPGRARGLGRAALGGARAARAKCICMCMCMCVYAYVCMYIYIYISKTNVKPELAKQKRERKYCINESYINKTQQEYMGWRDGARVHDLYVLYNSKGTRRERV